MEKRDKEEVQFGGSDWRIEREESKVEDKEGKQVKKYEGFDIRHKIKDLNKKEAKNDQNKTNFKTKKPRFWGKIEPVSQKTKPYVPKFVPKRPGVCYNGCNCSKCKTWKNKFSK